MQPLSLKEDLILDFQEQKKALAGQMDLINPMATSLRKPAARRMADAGFLIFLEILVWAACLSCIAFLVFMNKLYPFYYLSQLKHDTDIKSLYNLKDLEMLDWCIKGLGLLAALLLFIIARMVHKIRQKNSVLNLAGKNMKLLAEQFIKRKASMGSLMEKHSDELPINDDAIILPPQRPHNDLLL